MQRPGRWTGGRRRRPVRRSLGRYQHAPASGTTLQRLVAWLRLMEVTPGWRTWGVLAEEELRPDDFLVLSAEDVAGHRQERCGGVEALRPTPPRDGSSAVS